MELFYHFTNRHNGVSKNSFSTNNLALHVKDKKEDVLTNRTLTCKALNLKYLQPMNQIHSNKAITINAPQPPPTCDAIMTNKASIALMVLVADCIPLLLYDEKQHAIAAIHAGRKGAFLDIVTTTIQKMQTSYNTNPREIKAFLGPSIKQCCYEISGEVLQEAKQKFPAFLKENFLDIRGIVKSQLQALHVKKIYDNYPCTCCDKDYFSYRRDGKTGRFAGVIMLRKSHA